MPKERLHYLDMAKGVGIFLVILGHIEYIQESTLRWIYSFHMPLFFVIGGILLYRKETLEGVSKDSLKKRAKGTLIPYVSFSLILLTMHTFEYFMQPGRITGRELARLFVDCLTGYGLHTLWFLITYFLAGTLFSFLQRSLQKKTCAEWSLGILVLLCTVFAFVVTDRLPLSQYPSLEKSLLWHAGMNVLIVLLRIFFVLPFFGLGWHYAKAQGPTQKRGQLFGFGLLLFLAGSLLSRYNPVLDLHYLCIYPMHYVAAAAACMGLLDIMRFLPVSRVLTYLGRNSLVIMCTHAGMFVLYYVSLGMFFVRKFIPMTDSILYVSIAVMVCVAEIPVIWIFNHYLKHLLGRT